MRKIVSGMYITLDGVTEAPEQWNPPYNNDEMTESVMAQIAESDTHLYGRRSYELFQSVFTGPAADRIPHAELMTAVPKVVVSSTLTDATWGPTKVIRADISSEIARLKELPGKKINIGASATLVRALLEAGLLDELVLFIHPVVLGHGARLFDGVQKELRLHLLQSRTFSTGVVSVRYALGS